jgi:hypothetical protein
MPLLFTHAHPSRKWGGVLLRAFTEHHPQFRNTIESRMRGERAKNTTPPHTPYPITADPW